MTTPPLPASPCIRVRLGYTLDGGTDAGNRFYFSYSGAAPSAANCVTLGTDIANLWASNIASIIYSETTLTEVDVLDIATDSGAFGTVEVTHAGDMSAGILSANAAINVEFDIARRYRGGKPRLYWPAPDDTSLVSGDKYSSGFIATVNAATTAFFAGIEALSVGSMGTLDHVNLSYYQGFHNVTNSSGRTRAAPVYRTSALLDAVTGYACKAVVGSQRRRRTSTTE
jgi:hypothetical protein